VELWTATELVTAEAATSTGRARRQREVDEGPRGAPIASTSYPPSHSQLSPPSSPSPGPARSQIKGTPPTPPARAGTRHGHTAQRLLALRWSSYAHAPTRREASRSASVPVASARAPPALAPWRRLPLRRRRRWHGHGSTSSSPRRLPPPPGHPPRPPRRRPAASSAAWVGRPGTGRRGGGASGRRARGWTWTWPAAPSR
jgi:hypothetical protein